MAFLYSILSLKYGKFSCKDFFFLTIIISNYYYFIYSYYYFPTINVHEILVNAKTNTYPNFYRVVLR